MNNEATYCPEDDKLRLYVGRVPREEYLALRKQGWVSTPKQDCDFVATWTPSREDTALEYAGSIEDEDQSPTERAADRAERFGGYRDKRLSHGYTLADTYEEGPKLIGHQSAALAERRVKALDRVGDRAVNQWEKAEYWQRRTAGVIRHALHKSTPGVRMGRIKTLEAELRKMQKTWEEQASRRELWEKVLAESDTEMQDKLATHLANYSASYRTYKHPRPDEVTNPVVRKEGAGLWTLLTMHDGEWGKPITGKEAAEMWLAGAVRSDHSQRWERHLKLRLEYENQMLEAVGGRAAFVEMEPGGFIGEHQVIKVNKSPATGRVVSVNIMAPRVVYDKNNQRVEKIVPITLNVERMKSDVYRPPTDEERAAYQAKLEAERKERAKGPKAPSLINPTMEDAQALMDIWNERGRKAFEAHPDRRYMTDYTPLKVREMTQEQYSQASKGSYAKACTIELCAGGYEKARVRYGNWRDKEPDRGPVLCKVRVHGWSGARSIIVLTNKPQKSLPQKVLEVKDERNQQVADAQA